MKGEDKSISLLDLSLNMTDTIYPHMRSAWLVVGLQSGCSGSLVKPVVPLWKSVVNAAVLTVCQN